jgi:hypothetical protein
VGRIEGRTDNATKGIKPLEISIIWYVTYNTDEASRFV